MKKLIYLFVLAVLAGSISSCKQENRPQIVNGIVYDATMNNITLITGKGDTINISTMDANPDKVPGVLLEDSVEVTCIKEKIEGGENLLSCRICRTVSDIIITRPNDVFSGCKSFHSELIL